MLADHLCSEKYVIARRSENVYDEWRMKKPQVADNDLWDALVGKASLASFAGIESASAKAPASGIQRFSSRHERQDRHFRQLR